MHFSIWAVAKASGRRVFCKNEVMVSIKLISTEILTNSKQYM